MEWMSPVARWALLAFTAPSAAPPPQPWQGERCAV